MSKARDNKKLIVGLDVGTSKIAAIVAEVKPEGGFEIIGMGSHPSRGLKKGVVVNIETTVNAIQRALEEAELMADCKIREVYTGIAGSHIRSFNSQGMVAVKDKEVALADIERVVDTARAVQIPNDQQILHVLNQEFIIDGQEDVREPLGMSGVRLHQVADLEPAAAVISDDEKDLGAALVDIGGGTSDLVVYTHGAIRHTAVIPIAGDQITNDIAMALRTPTKDAEDIKERYGCALSQLADPQDMVEVPGLGERDTRQLSRKTLAEVIEPRVEELYSLVQTELRRSGYEELLSSGVVITGGSSVMQGMVELGEEIFHMPVRVGYPAYHGALAEAVRHPRHSTGVGLLLAGMQQLRNREIARMSAGSFRQVLERMKTWFTGNF